MIYWLIMYEFFKIGLFSFGGGYATLPFLYHIAEHYSWYSIQELTHMIAVASITPGPVGINTATYAGFKTLGIFGAMLATTSEMIPSFLLVIAVSKLLKNYSENFYVKSIIETLKPVSCALLISVAIGLIKPQLNDLKSILLLGFLILISLKSKRDPILYMAIAGATGICLKFLI